MEDRKLNEKESLELIAQMIQNSKKNVDQNAGGPVLIWGYATILISFLVYAAWMFVQQPIVMLGWLLIPVFGGLGNLWLAKGRKPVLITTHLDRVIKNIWLVMGSVTVAMSLTAFIFPLPILFFIGILCGASITLTGCVADNKVYKYCGISGMLLSFLCLLVKGPEQILIFAGVFFVMMVIPGHYLNRVSKQNA